MLLTSIDIGIFNMATVTARVSRESVNVSSVSLDNIKVLSDSCSDPKCHFRHEHCFNDYLDHYFQLHAQTFEESDKILVERQPPRGFIVIQELILKQYREKVILINPSTIHKHFGIQVVDYDARKEFTIAHAWEYLKDFKAFKENSRKHDMADAMCQLLYYNKTRPSQRVDLEYDGILGHLEFEELLGYCRMP